MSASSSLSTDKSPKRVHKRSAFVGGVVREVDHSTKTRACDFHPLGFRGRSLGEVFDRVDLCDGGVVNLPYVRLVNLVTSALPREKQEERRFAMVDREKRQWLIGTLEDGHEVRSGFPPAEELFYLHGVFVGYRSEPDVIGNRIATHGNHSNTEQPMGQRLHEK